MYSYQENAGACAIGALLHAALLANDFASVDREGNTAEQIYWAFKSLSQVNAEGKVGTSRDVLMGYCKLLRITLIEDKDLEAHLAQHADKTHTRVVSSLSGEHTLLPAIVFARLSPEAMHVCFVTNKVSSTSYRKRAHYQQGAAGAVGATYSQICNYKPAVQ